MFNNKFILLATLFGSDIRCVKTRVEWSAFDKEYYESYSEGDCYRITGVFMGDDEVLIRMKSDKYDYPIEEPLSLIQNHFELTA